MHKKDTYRLSIFSYEQDRLFQYSRKKEAEYNVKGYDAAIIRILAKYGLLTKNSLSIEMDRMMGNRKKTDYDKELSDLYNAGYIAKYHYTEKAERGQDNPVLYALSSPGFSYARKKDMKIGHEELPQNESYETATALEIASRNQWHISILDNYSDMIEADYYEYNTRVMGEKFTVIPSCICLRSDKLKLLSSVTIVSIEFPKKEAGEGAFFNTLLGANAFLNENPKKFMHPIFVIITETPKDMERIHKKISGYQILEKLPIYYTFDYNIYTRDGPLHWLYEVSTDDKLKKVIYKTVDLIK